MKNAHLRFGTLRYTRPTHDTTIDVRVRMDRLILEPRQDGNAIAHLISVVGNDADIGGIWAAVLDGRTFWLEGPELEIVSATLGDKPQCWRGSISIPGRKRPLRHLVAISRELALTAPGGDNGSRRTILCGDGPPFVLYRVAQRFGLPVVPQWADWFMEELQERKAIAPLTGLGCSPVVVKGTGKAFLDWIGKSVKRRVIQLPDTKQPIRWPSFDGIWGRKNTGQTADSCH
ncbi:MAG: hypothetical protein EPN47_04930 [Acidobacteria bacterium]|nr:MAG: hypothetical protein EPN47_04930 [Acidobacteriota bacterium]